MTNTAGARWYCEAYGPGGPARCFFAGPAVEGCATAEVCHDLMAAERRVVFTRIQEQAAAGDQTAAYLAAVITHPDQLLGGAITPADEAAVEARAARPIGIPYAEDVLSVGHPDFPDGTEGRICPECDTFVPETYDPDGECLTTNYAAHYDAEHTRAPYLHLGGLNHRHAEGEGWREHNHDAGNVAHRHDPATGFQVPPA